MLEVRLTSQARADVDQILAYLLERSAQGAASWANRWEETVHDLAHSGHRRPLAPEDAYHSELIRHVVFRTRRGRSYRALFTVRGEILYILHVRGPGQDLVPPNEMGSP